MEKLIIRIPKSERAGKEPIIRLSDEAMKALEEVYKATGLPLKQLASKMILYACENVEIVEE